MPYASSSFLKILPMPIGFLMRPKFNLCLRLLIFSKLAMKFMITKGEKATTFEPE
jgi:hypothetical protein